MVTSRQVGQEQDVVGVPSWLLVRVRVEHCLHRDAGRRLRAYHLNADLIYHLRHARLADRRVGRCAGQESALTRRGETADRVLADGPCAALGERDAYRIRVTEGYVYDDCDEVTHVGIPFRATGGLARLV